jgi:hypothetical protein
LARQRGPITANTSCIWHRLEQASIWRAVSLVRDTSVLGRLDVEEKR